MKVQVSNIREQEIVLSHSMDEVKGLHKKIVGMIDFITHEIKFSVYVNGAIRFHSPNLQNAIETYNRVR